MLCGARRCLDQKHRSFPAWRDMLQTTSSVRLMPDTARWTNEVYLERFIPPDYSGLPQNRSSGRGACRRQWRMKACGSVVSRRNCQAISVCADKLPCEPDRANEVSRTVRTQDDGDEAGIRFCLLVQPDSAAVSTRSLALIPPRVILSRYGWRRICSEA